MIYSCVILQWDSSLETVFFFLVEQACFFSIIQHCVSSLWYSRLSQTFTNSVCTCCFSGKQRHHIFLTPRGSHNPCFLVCRGALGEAGCSSVSCCLDLLTRLPGWTSNLTHYSLIQDTSSLVSWSCVGDCAVLGGSALPAGGPPPQILACLSRSNWSLPWRCR